MKYTAGYDRDFAEQFFRRTIHGLVPGNGNSFGARIFEEEKDYMARKLAETAVFPTTYGFGSPWYFGNAEDLAEATRKTTDRGLLQKAEQAALQLLILEGVVARGGLWQLREKRQRRAYKCVPLAEVLYHHASNQRTLCEQQRFTLRRMSLNAGSWSQILSNIPGNDYLEMLAEQPSSLLILPGN